MMKPFLTGSVIVRRSIVLAVLITVASSSVALTIKNHYSPLNKKRPRRKETRYIVLHTTEGPLKGSLAKVHRYGETHYLVDESGIVYRIIDKRRVAAHAGRSMWYGRTNLDEVSIGIEVVGYHDKGITTAQYKALHQLLGELQKGYSIPDERVLTHSMVAYGEPNKWHKRPHRGRKRCGMLFARDAVRARMGLTERATFDPDVRAGRLVVADLYLERTLYPAARTFSVAARSNASAPLPKGEKITATRSAWDIAKTRYKRSTTIYTLPDGRRLRGCDITNWKSIPAGTYISFTH